MSLLVPLALLGFITIPAILLLHLLRNRREMLPISSLRLWRDLQQKRKGALPRSIPITLMLVLQLLIAAALTLGLAQPVASFLRSKPQHTIFILDTTTSMMAEDASPSDTAQFITENTSLGAFRRRFDLARQTIQAELDALNETDSFVIIGLNRQPEVLLSGDGSQKSQARLALDNIVPGGTGLDLAAALTLANGLLVEDRPNRLVVLSDGNFSADPETLPAVLAPLEWQTIGPGETAANLPLFANQALLNVSSQPLPDGRHRLFARIINYGDEAVERTVRVLVDDRLLDQIAVRLAARAETERVWTLPAPSEVAAVEIVEPDVLGVDNRAELLLRGARQHEVLLLSETPSSPDEAAQPGALQRALEAQPGVTVTAADLAVMSDYDLGAFDLVVFDGLPIMLTTWPVGNLLVVNPPLGHPLLPAQNFARNLRPDFETTSPLLAGVDLSGVYFNRLPNLTVPDWATLDAAAVSANDASVTYPLIFHGDVGTGQVVVWTFDLNQSNLPARLALPLLTGNTLSTLLSSTLLPAVSLGEPVPLDRSVRVEIPGGRRLSLAAEPAATAPFSRTKQVGLYRLYNQNDRQVGGFAVHAGSTLESNLTTHFDPATLVEIDTGPATVPPERVLTEYWPWLAGAALIFIVVEGGLAWLR